MTALADVLAAIDADNQTDPTSVDYRGEAHPTAMIHGQLAGHWLGHLRPDAGDADLIAARAHHFRRWTRPRADYPGGRAGYLRWRRDANFAQGTDLEEFLTALAVDPDDAHLAAQLVAKTSGLPADSAQAHEDVRCLAFLDTQLDGLSEQIGDAAIVKVLRRTLKKMSPEAIALSHHAELTDAGRAALAAASLPPD